jgi:hypothetical protein
LGNKRPPLLLRVEKELFSSLFRLATQNVCIVTEMRDCISRMPWDDLNAINHSESSWFKPAGGDISASASLSTSDAGSERPAAIGGGNLAADNPAPPGLIGRSEESASSGSARPQPGTDVRSVK